MDVVYIGLVDTPGFFAYLIRCFIGIPYVHTVISMDSRLEEAYSIGRRNPAIPLFAGFEKEDKGNIVKVFPDARYQVFCVPCSAGQREQIGLKLLECYENRFSYHYCVLGLPFLLLGRHFYQKNHYTCSSFIANLLEENGIRLFDKHFSLVTPRDFHDLEGKEVLFEGKLRLLAGKDWSLDGCAGAAYE